jgi:hypothetical protein
MGLFCGELMFTATYSFGEVEIHPLVIQELETWIIRKNAKLRKFGEPVLNQILQYAQKQTGKLKNPTEQQIRKGRSFINAIESRLPPENISAATSSTDKDLLIAVHANGANLSTQERTLTAVAKKSFGEARVFCFEDMILDLHRSNVLALEKIKDGHIALVSMNESLRLREYPELQKILK